MARRQSRRQLEAKYKASTKGDLRAELKRRGVKTTARALKDRLVDLILAHDFLNVKKHAGGGSTPRFTDDQIIEALEENYSLVSLAARALGCSRQAIYDAMDRSPKVLSAYRSTTEENLDLAESKLIKLFSEEKFEEHKDFFPALRFFLRTKGRERGYGDRVRHDVVDASKMEAFVNELESAINDADLSEEQRIALASAFRDAAIRFLPR
jgi:predicted DNA-binding protein YlxM (UPF0122 family)